MHSHFTRMHDPYEGSGVLRLGLDQRSLSFGLQKHSQVLVPKLVLLGDRLSPSYPKVAFLVLRALVDASGPSYPKVAFLVLRALVGASGPSYPKVGFLVLRALVDASGPSGVFVTQRRKALDRSGDVF